MSNKKCKISLPNPVSLDLPATGVDTHAHLDTECFICDLDAVIAKSRCAGVAAIGNVFLNFEAWRNQRDRLLSYPDVFFLMGIHPHEAKFCTNNTLSDIANAFVVDPKLKALGEIGLDFFWIHSSKEDQLAIFTSQLILARERNLPVVVHCRDAITEMLNLLFDYGFRYRPLLWHCFSGDPDLAAIILANGWYLSISGAITFSKSYNLRAAVAIVPLERLVLETDCPYLTPVPYRGKRNEPAMLGFTAATVAAVKGLPLASVWTACGDTARRFFGLLDCNS